MVTKAKAFPSKWLKAADLGDEEVVATIAHVSVEKLKDYKTERMQDKYVCYFKTRLPPMVLNLVNWESIATALNEEDSDRWPDGKIIVYATETTVQGKTVPCVRVKPVKAKAPKKEPALALPEADPLFNDEMPDFA